MRDMNDTPEWIRKRNAQKESIESQQAAIAQQSVKVSTLLSTQGPHIWQRFVDALRVNALALSKLKLDDEQLAGATTPSGTPPINCQVNVERRSVRRGPQQNRIVFHYDSGRTDLIRVTPMSGQEQTLPLRKGPDDIVGLFYENSILTPEKMAEKIIQQMADSVLR
jgi:hypothetical protein